VVITGGEDEAHRFPIFVQLPAAAATASC
jgi:hypothetical protein